MAEIAETRPIGAAEIAAVPGIVVARPGERIDAIFLCALIDLIADLHQHVGRGGAGRLLIAVSRHLLRHERGVAAELQPGLYAGAGHDIEALPLRDCRGIAGDLGRQARRAAGQAKRSGANQSGRRKISQTHVTPRNSKTPWVPGPYIISGAELSMKRARGRTNRVRPSGRGRRRDMPLREPVFPVPPHAPSLPQGAGRARRDRAATARGDHGSAEAMRRGRRRAPA